MDWLLLAQAEGVVSKTTEAIAAGAVIIVVMAFLGVLKIIFDKMEKRDTLFCNTVENVHEDSKALVESVHAFCNKQVENVNLQRDKERESNRKDFSDMRSVVEGVLRPRGGS